MTVLDRFRLDDKVVVVTGASSGLGVAFAQAFAEAGADLVLGARRVDRLPETGKLVEAAGRRYAYEQTDVTDPEQCTALVQKAVDEFGRVDVLVNNAGLGWAKPATRETPAEFLRVIDVNLNGAYWMAQAFGRAAKDGGSIINISSVLGLHPGALPAGGLRRLEGRAHRPDPRPRRAVDRPQGHPRQRHRAGLLPDRDDRRDGRRRRRSSSRRSPPPAGSATRPSSPPSASSSPATPRRTSPASRCRSTAA